jgi:hypothetical protein
MTLHLRSMRTLLARLRAVQSRSNEPSVPLYVQADPLYKEILLEYQKTGRFDIAAPWSATRFRRFN